ncbi:MAG: ferredoxin [Nitriliruptoraceae bacterium]
MTYVIAEPCMDVKDKACVEECPVDCIYEGDRMLYIHPGECIDCAACEPACPVEAIFYADDVPDEWKSFTSVNAEFFDDSVTALGAPGGASDIGPTKVDHPQIATYEVSSAT